MARLTIGELSRLTGVKETTIHWYEAGCRGTTPCLLGLFSLVALLAARLRPVQRKAVADSAWYRKHRPTFSDTLATVRRPIWQEQDLLTSRRRGHVPKPRPVLSRALAYALCHAA